VGLIDKPLNPQERRLKELQSGIEEEWISLSVFTNKVTFFSSKTFFPTSFLFFLLDERF
jgi:hypothetical protein